MFRIKGYNGNAGMEEPEWVKRDAPIDNDIADLTWESAYQRPAPRKKLIATVRPKFD